MNNPTWRRKAKDLLFNYTTSRTLLRQAEADIIYGRTPARDHCYRRGGIANPTLKKAQLLNGSEQARLKQEIQAVEKLVCGLQTNRRIDRLCLQLLQLVYFQGRTSLLGAAVHLEISERTAKRWNNKALIFIAQEMGWLDREG